MRHWWCEPVTALNPASWRVSWAGRFLHAWLPYRRDVVMQNIRTVFAATLSHADQVRLAKAFYSHLATCLKETIQVRFLSDEALQQRVEVRGHEHLLDVAAQGRGVLIVTAHVGSWEFAPLGGILNFKQFKGHFHFIRRRLGNKWLEKILFKRYEHAGLHVITKDNALTHVDEALAKNHAVVFVLDQHASLANRDGIAVPFFGKQAGTYRSLATLSRHTGIPVVPASSYRLPNGQHVLAFHEPIAWQEKATTQASLYENTRAYNQALEQIILAHPEQWMWLHKRWKLK